MSMIQETFVQFKQIYRFLNPRKSGNFTISRREIYLKNKSRDSGFLISDIGTAITNYCTRLALTDAQNIELQLWGRVSR